MNKERVLNIAKALRESPAPNDFTMSRYANHCGTPACALGHYAAREDLQDLLKFDPTQGPYCAVRIGDKSATHANEEVLEHFGITQTQASQLFGCESEADEFLDDGEVDARNFLVMTAGTANEAATWIEHFVATHE